MKNLLPIAVLLLAAGCGSNDVSFSIDNPTGAPIKLQIDQTPYEIAAHQAKEVALKAGEHSMDAPATGKIKFIVYAERKGGLINPTLSDYVIVSEAYTTDEKSRKNFRPGGGGPFELDGVPFNGPYRHVNGLFIEKDWRFGVKEPFPDTLRGYDAGGGNIFRKIFTAPDFVSYFEKQSEQPGFFEKNRKHLTAQARKPLPPAALPTFADPQLQSASLKLRDLYQRYRQAADPAEQIKLQGEHFKLTMDFTSLAAPRLSSLPAEESAKYGEFVIQGGKAMGESALVKGE